MAMMAIIMGIGVGYLQNIGTGSRHDQARAILRETVYACKQSSNGGTRAILDLRARPRRRGPRRAGPAVAQPVLTHNFETLDGLSDDYPLEEQGEIEFVDGGHTGRRCALRARRGPGVRPRSRPSR